MIILGILLLTSLWHGGGGFISCDAVCPYCRADPGCQKNIVHADAPPGASPHKCRKCNRSWNN